MATTNNWTLTSLGVRRLKDICTARILSALLEQRPLLEADQLHTRIPNYVPTTVRDSITCLFKAYTSPPPPSPKPGAQLKLHAGTLLLQETSKVKQLTN